MNPSMRALMEDYADFHQHPMNRLTHKVAIPLIVFHIIAMLDWISLTQVGDLTLTLAYPTYILGCAWYLKMSPKIGVILSILYALCFPIAWVTPRYVVVLIAIIGWLIQLAGHVVWEKRSPAFLTNLLQALVGPAFFVALLTGDFKE